MAQFPCFKCNGKGTLTFCSHIENGKCFQCAGTGKLSARKIKALDAISARIELPVTDRCTENQLREITRLAIVKSTCEQRLADEAGVPETRGMNDWRYELSRKQASQIIGHARGTH